MTNIKTMKRSTELIAMLLSYLVLLLLGILFVAA
jgi:hypothetical protein